MIMFVIGIAIGLTIAIPLLGSVGSFSVFAVGWWG